MNNFTSTNLFMFEYMKNDLKTQIDRVKFLIFQLEQQIYDNPELLFNKLSLENGNTTKIVAKIKEYENCLKKYNEDLEKINMAIRSNALELERKNDIDSITKQMNNTHF